MTRLGLCGDPKQRVLCVVAVGDVWSRRGDKDGRCIVLGRTSIVLHNILYYVTILIKIKIVRTEIRHSTSGTVGKERTAFVSAYITMIVTALGQAGPRLQ
jgi:hypothetical protein